MDHANRGSNLVLIGFMGTGKTSVGKRVAQSLDFPFVDLDEQIVEREGRSIAQIFADQGESYFRKIESQVLLEASQGERQVISTGGGIVTVPANHAILGAAGPVIWLQVSPEAIYERVKRNRDRPLLATDDPEKTIRNLLAAREELYRKCADLTILTDELSLEETIYGVTETARFWEKEGRLGRR